MSDGFKLRIDNLVSALVGGAAGGLLVWLAVPHPAETPTPDTTQEVASAPTADAPPSDPDFESEADRLRKLEASLSGLQKRVTEQARVDVFEEPDGGDAKRVTLSATDPKFQNAVRAVMDKAKWEAEQEERDKRDEQEDKRVIGQLNELIETLELSDAQADQVEVVLRSRSDTFRALRDGDGQPTTRKEWQEKFAEIQADTRKKLAAILDAGQLEAYEKHQEEQWGPFGRPQRGNQQNR